MFFLRVELLIPSYFLNYCNIDHLFSLDLLNASEIVRVISVILLRKFRILRNTSSFQFHVACYSPYLLSNYPKLVQRFLVCPFLNRMFKLVSKAGFRYFNLYFDSLIAV